MYYLHSEIKGAADLRLSFAHKQKAGHIHILCVSHIFCLIFLDSHAAGILSCVLGRTDKTLPQGANSVSPKQRTG